MEEHRNYLVVVPMVPHFVGNLIANVIEIALEIGAELADIAEEVVNIGVPAELVDSNYLPT